LKNWNISKTIYEIKQFDEILHTGIPDDNGYLKIRNFKNPKWWMAAISNTV